MKNKKNKKVPSEIVDTIKEGTSFVKCPNCLGRGYVYTSSTSTETSTEVDQSGTRPCSVCNGYSIVEVEFDF